MSMVPEDGDTSTIANGVPGGKPWLSFVRGDSCYLSLESTCSLITV